MTKVDVRPRSEVIGKSEPNEIAEALRDGLRSLAKAVAVITCEHDGQRYAMTATAVSELSMDPPSMLVCVNKTASLYEPLSNGADFCINILCTTHSEISTLCSGKVKGESRFAVGSWLKSPLGPPYLEDAQASIFCRNVSKNFEHGTHNIFIGEVEQVLRQELANPLVYMDGRYGAFAGA